MLLRAAAIAAFTLAGLTAAHAVDAQCVLNADKSSLSMIVSNATANAYACTAACKYTVTGQRPLQTFGCNYDLAANASEQTACQLDGAGPNHFNELQPVHMTCQPR